jgi:hypothetical protein
MLKGSGGIGGRKYQITAALLTYAAVSLGAIPIMLHQYSKEKKDHPPAQVQTQSQSPASPSADQPATGSPPQPSPSTPKTPEKPAVGTLVLLGLASPFLELADPLHGLIGLVILFVGLQIAWKMMGRPKLQIEGPL